MEEIMCSSCEGTRNNQVMEVGVSRRVVFVCFSAAGNKSDLPEMHELDAVDLAAQCKSPCSVTAFAQAFPAFFHKPLR